VAVLLRPMPLLPVTRSVVLPVLPMLVVLVVARTAEGRTARPRSAPAAS